MKKAFKIDPIARSITEVKIDDYKDIQREVEGLFQVGTEYDIEGKTDSVFVNEEGLYLDSEWFEIEGGHQPFRGCGLVLGFDPLDGDSTDANITLEELKSKVKFVSSLEIALRARTGNL